MKGWVGLVGLPTLVVTHQLQVERRTGKVRRPETDVLPLCYATNLWNVNVSKTAINDKLQGSVAKYLRCGGVVNNQIKRRFLLSLRVKKKLKSARIRQSNKQERDCLVHFLRLLAVCWPGAQSSRDNHVLAGSFAKYSPFKKIQSKTQQ